MKHLLVSTSIILLATASQADIYTWTGKESGSMNDPLNYEDELGATPMNAPGVGDTILFSNLVSQVGHMPTNTSASARFDTLRFMADGYTLASTANLFYLRINVDAGVTLTNRAALSWVTAGTSRVVLGANAKFVQNGTFVGTVGPEDFFVQFGANSEMIFISGGKSMKTVDSSNNYFITFENNVSFYMGLAQGTPRIRTTGANLNFGNDALKFERNDIYFGGAGSGDISKPGEFQLNDHDNRNIYVENIVFRGGTFNMKSDGSHDFAKQGNGVYVVNSNSTLSRGDDTKHRGLRIRVANGTLSVNATIVNYSRQENNREGLRVESGARLTGVGTINTFSSTDGNLKRADIYGTIAPGCQYSTEGNRVGKFTYIGTNFTFRAGSKLEIKAGREKQDWLVVNAAPITLETTGAGVTLNVIPLDSGTVPAPFVILENPINAPIIGRFAGLPEGAKVTASANGITKRYFITYFGGNGHDIALTPIPENTLMLLR